MKGVQFCMKGLLLSFVFNYNVSGNFLTRGKRACSSGNKAALSTFTDPRDFQLLGSETK